MHFDKDTHKSYSIQKFTIKHKLKKIETDNEEQDDLNRVRELEEATETVDEAQNHVASTNADESLCDKLLNLPSPKVSVSRAGIKSMHMEQTMLLKKMDPKRLKDEPGNNNDCYTHECKHCKKLMKFAWKEKGELK